MTVFARPGASGALMSYDSRYGNFIRGRVGAADRRRVFRESVAGDRRAVLRDRRARPPPTSSRRSTPRMPPSQRGARPPPAERAVMLNKIADRIEANLEIAGAGRDVGQRQADPRDDGRRPAAGHRSFPLLRRRDPRAGGLDLAEIDDDTVAYHFHEPLGVVGQIIPWNFPILMATWKLAPALAAGNCVVLKPAEQTPASILYLMELIGDLLPPGVLNVVNGFGVRGRQAAGVQRPDRQDRVHGRDHHRPADHAVRQPEPDPGHAGARRQVPNIFFADVLATDDDFHDKALEGFTMFALNQGEVCTCPSRSLIQEDIYDRVHGAGARSAPRRSSRATRWTPTTMIGAQASNDQLEKILSYIEIGKQEGAEVLTGGERAELGGDLAGGYYVQPTVFKGNNKMRIFQEEIFGPVVSVTTFNDYDEALAIANDTLYGLGAGVWTRDGNTALPGRPRHQGRPGVDQLLPRLSGARGVRRLQAVRHRAREPQDDARPLPADEEPAGVATAQGPGVFLMSACAKKQGRTDECCGRGFDHRDGRRAAAPTARSARRVDVSSVRRLL